ncbi:hypothetical protein [Polyangium sorediatum]|uniref:Uncharacterized protein n=1 Tax=Polyangium sorediatum TaxID=889274 RepID=A0ABT6PA83_9BACT|nr:hypothetical protein [Polyangium sorediatum]MDI1437533.1 hypothetical protein [Polyangium sorediatum]
MATLLAAALLAAGAVASADVVADGPTREQIRAIRPVREGKKELREAPKAGADAKELREDKKEIGEDKKEPREERKAKRQTKREAKRKELREKWGDVLKQPDARAELKVHARRAARLAQARKVADADGKEALVARIDKLVEKENARHQRVMDRLKEKAPGGAP